MARARPLFRASCTFLILLGLAGSVVEGVGCKDYDQGWAGSVSSLTKGAQAIGEPVPLSGQGTGHYCPCIHTFPVGTSVSESLVSVLLSGDAGFSFASQLTHTRRPEPPVPPPLS